MTRTTHHLHLLAPGPFCWIEQVREVDKWDDDRAIALATKLKLGTTHYYFSTTTGDKPPLIYLEGPRVAMPSECVVV